MANEPTSPFIVPGELLDIVTKAVGGVDRPLRTAQAALSGIPDGWAKVRGKWRHLPWLMTWKWEADVPDPNVSEIVLDPEGLD